MLLSAATHMSALCVQANKLLPELRIQDAADSSDPSAAAAGGNSSSSSEPPPKHITTSGADHAVDEDTLAQCIGYFLRVCPGLNKTTIGELLGEPDRFYLKVRLWVGRCVCVWLYAVWSAICCEVD
jgi:hypothetical protein